jgi:glycosyltransferase involved in cell wall biosynthesis
VSVVADPDVSVVVPVHNAAALIGQTIRAILDQRDVALEVLVIDDGSRDDSAARCLALGDARLRVIGKTQGGVSSARNVGMREARGRWIAFCDQDDVWHPRKLALQLAALAQWPQARLGATGARLWLPDAQGRHGDPMALLDDRDATRPNPRLAGWIYHEMLLQSCVLTSTALVERTLAAEIGDWDEALPYGEDWDWWLRAARLSPCAYLAAPLVAYRQHLTQGSRQPRPENWSEIVLQRAIARWGLRGPDGRAPDPQAFRRRRARDWQGHGALHLQAGSRLVAARSLWHAIRLDPGNRGSWQLLARACLPGRPAPMPTLPPADCAVHVR